AIEKDRELRYQHASDIRAELKRLKRDTDSGRLSSSRSGVVQELVAGPATRSAGADHPSAGIARKRYAVLAACFVLLLGAAFAAYHFWSRSNPPGGPAKITQISQWNRPMNGARLSPDGHAVAFSSPVGSVAQVFLMLTSGGEPLQLTNDEGGKYVDGFSSDGKEIYYGRSLGLGEVWAVPTLGGAPHRVVTGYGVVPSSDGAFIYYRKAEGGGIYRSEKSGLNEELAYNPEGTSEYFIPLLAFPDGNDLLAAGILRNYEAKSRLYKINAISHEAVDLGEVSGNRDFVWAEPGKSVLFSRSVNGLTNIWNYSLGDRSLTQITFGTGPDFSPMPDPGGKGIYYVNGQSSGTLTAYRVKSKESKDIVSEEASIPSISSDGKRVAYSTLVAGKRHDLWAADIDGGNKVKIAAAENMGFGSFAPDNFHLTFVEHESGTGVPDRAYIVGADGTGLRPIPRTASTIWSFAWSADQKNIYVTGVESAGSKPVVWKWSVESSNPEKFMDFCGSGIVTAADPSGRYLLGVVLFGEKAGIYEVSVSSRECIPLLPGVVTFSTKLDRNGKSFLYAVAPGGEVTIFRQPWKDGKTIGAPQVALRVPFTFPLTTNLSGGGIGSAYTFSADLSTIVYLRPGGHADLYLLSQK